MICSICHIDKPQKYFSGKDKRCKSCNVIRIRNYYKIHKNKRVVIYRKWYEKKGRNRAVNYQEAIYHWIEKHPQEIKAEQLLRYAVKKGDILKPNKCDYCLEDRRLNGHHVNYAQPYNVLWLCGSCHKNIHLTPK